MDEVLGQYISHGASTVVSWHCYSRGQAHEMFHGAGITVVGWHSCWRGLFPQGISMSQQYCDSLAHIMDEVRVHTMFHRAGISVFCWKGYGQCRCPEEIFIVVVGMGEV